MADLASLKKTLLFTEEDERALRQSKAILVDQTDAVLDVWYGFVASTPELVYFFSSAKTDGADSVPQINFRYLPALTIPITAMLKPFLAKKRARRLPMSKRCTPPGSRRCCCRASCAASRTSRTASSDTHRSFAFN